MNKELSRQCSAILAALRRRPALGHELNAIAHRFGGRIHDLRRKGYDIRAKMVRRGVWRYELVKGSAR